MLYESVKNVFIKSGATIIYFLKILCFAIQNPTNPTVQ